MWQNNFKISELIKENEILDNNLKNSYITKELLNRIIRKLTKQKFL